MTFHAHPHRSTRGFAKLQRVLTIAAATTTMSLGLLAGTQSVAFADSDARTITAASSFLNVAVRGASTSPGADLIQWTADSGAEQQWMYITDGPGPYYSYEIENVNSGYCIATDGTPGDPLTQEPCFSGPDYKKGYEYWREVQATVFSPDQLTNDDSGLTMDVSGYSSNSGAEIDGWKSNGGLNQQFYGLDGAVAPNPSLQVNPSTVAFNSQTVGTTHTQAVTITNTGNLAWAPGSSSSDRAGVGLVAGGTCDGITLAPGKSCTTIVSYAPPAAGAYNATITIDSNFPNPTELNVTGTGTGAIASVQVSPVAFGSQTVGTTQTKAVTITNPSTSNADWTPGANSSNRAGVGLVAGGSCDGTTLTPGNSCTTIVSYDPLAAGAYNATITIDSNFSTPTVLNVTGTGAIASVQVSPVAFGSQTVGTTQTKAVTITNTGNVAWTPGANSSNRAGVGLVAGGSCDGITLTPGNSCTTIVSYDPLAAGAYNATITIDSNFPNPTVLNVTGTGIN